MGKSLFTGFILLLTALRAVSEVPANLHIAHCLEGCPAGTPATNEILVRHLYAVSVNAQTRLADWVSYRVMPDSIGVASLLPREWLDDELTHNGVRLDDLDGESNSVLQERPGNQQDSVYRISEFSVNAGDRGRLIPMTSFAATSYWPDLNLLSVMTPIKSDLRLESWARLDQAINHLARQTGEVYVVAGPVYGAIDALQVAAGNGGSPAAFFKVVASPEGEVAAFLFAQDLPVHANYCEQAIDFDLVEPVTALELFPRAVGWPSGSLVRQLGC